MLNWWSVFKIYQIHFWSVFYCSKYRRQFFVHFFCLHVSGTTGKQAIWATTLLVFTMWHQVRCTCLTFYFTGSTGNEYRFRLCWIPLEIAIFFCRRVLNLTSVAETFDIAQLCYIIGTVVRALVISECSLCNGKSAIIFFSMWSSQSKRSISHAGTECYKDDVESQINEKKLDTLQQLIRTTKAKSQN